MTENYFNGGAGYSGTLSLLVSARFTCNSSNSRDGAITVDEIPPVRLLTSGSLPAALKSLRNARTSNSLNTAPRTNSSSPSFPYTRYSSRGAVPAIVSTRYPYGLPCSVTSCWTRFSSAVGVSASELFSTNTPGRGGGQAEDRKNTRVTPATV